VPAIWVRRWIGSGVSFALLYPGTSECQLTVPLLQSLKVNVSVPHKFGGFGPVPTRRKSPAL
jgi:hypothetical protein